MSKGQLLSLSSALARRTHMAELGLDDVRRAEARLKGYVRATPIMRTWLTGESGARSKVDLKLENLQVTGGFMARGALSAVLSLQRQDVARGLVGFGLMDGSGVAFAASTLQVPSVVYLHRPRAHTALVKTLESWGATVLVGGKSLADVRVAAIERASRDGLTFVDSTASSAYIAGCGTVAWEMLDFSPNLDVLITPGGQGPLLAGVALVAKLLKPGIRVIGVGKALPSRRGTVAGPAVIGMSNRAAVRSIFPHAAPLCLDLIQHHVDEFVFISEEEQMDAARMLWSEMEVRTGGFGASSAAALLSSKVVIHPSQEVGAVIGTAGGDGLFEI